MKAIRATIGQAGILLLLGLSVGVGTNAIRGKNHIKISRDYKPQIPRAGGGQATSRPYPVVSLDEVMGVIQARGRFGLDVILDARRQEAYNQGHIPGALPCDPYSLDYCEDAVHAAQAAERVIVYCHGGDCQDSYLLCQELLLRGILPEQLYVFEGGWEAWQRHVAGTGTSSQPGAEHPADDNAAPAPAGGEEEEDATGQPFRVLSLREAVEIFEDEKTAQGVYVFVDARADEPFEAGHIPGAVQCDYYRIDYYFPELLTRAATAEKLIVYCNGADCEDSLYVCGELLRADVPKAKILLFKAGWEAWHRAGLPYATGRE